MFLLQFHVFYTTNNLVPFCKIIGISRKLFLVNLIGISNVSMFQAKNGKKMHSFENFLPSATWPTNNRHIKSQKGCRPLVFLSCGHLQAVTFFRSKSEQDYMYLFKKRGI